LTNFEFRITARFDRALRKLQKRFPGLKHDLADGLQKIELNPTVGSVIPGDYAIRKLRLLSRDMQRGKSGGFDSCTN
jgi:mRNA-degrading endonuclease RelE of RelBE toxin-antitoxin system